MPAQSLLSKKKKKLEILHQTSLSVNGHAAWGRGNPFHILGKAACSLSGGVWERVSYPLHKRGPQLNSPGILHFSKEPAHAEQSRKLLASLSSEVSGRILGYALSYSQPLLPPPQPTPMCKGTRTGVPVGGPGQVPAQAWIAQGYTRVGRSVLQTAISFI